MSAVLERRVGQALLSARTVERALHDPTGWVIRWGPHAVEASRLLAEDSITLSASLPDVCWITPPDGPVTLEHHGVLVGVRDIDYPGDGGVDIAWGLRVDNALRAA